MRARFAPVVAVAAAVAVAAVWQAPEAGDDWALRVADGAVGFVLVCAASVAHARRPTSRVGMLMGFAGLAWFAGSFVPGLAFVHRGPLVHLHISYPSGRIKRWPALTVVAVAYIAAIVEPIAHSDAATIVLSILIVVAAGSIHWRASGTARRAGRPALVAACAFATALGLASINRVAGWEADRALLWVYYAVVTTAVIGLVVDLLRARWADAVVSDLVIDLGRHDGTGTLQGAIGRALGDRNLVLAYWLPRERRYVDDGGRPIDATKPGPNRVATPINDGERPLAVLLHDAAVLEDPGLVAAVAEGARLAVSNAGMQAAARERVDALMASRRRIIEAGDAQRQRLEQELRTRVQPRLDIVAKMLEKLRDDPDVLPQGFPGELEAELTKARAELDDFARGLHPRVLVEDGLAAAITALPVGVGAQLSLHVTTGRLNPFVEATIYFVCAEALTNVAKHARARNVRIGVLEHDGTVTAEIEDDGLGGADQTRGSGLRSLNDRVEAVGGRLTVESPASGGTRLRVIIPA